MLLVIAAPNSYNQCVQTTPGVEPPIGYNVTHDNGVVAMAFAPGSHNPPAYSIGVDVMKVRLPGRESFVSFVETVGDQVKYIAIAAASLQ